LREVTLEARRNGGLLATSAIRVRVTPAWLQHDWWRDDVFNDAKTDFLRRDLGPMPPRDLLALLDLADRADDRQLFTRAGEVLVKREQEFNTPAYGSVFYRLSFWFVDEGDWGDALAERSLRLALAPQRAESSLGDRVKLRLAGLLIHHSDELDEAEKLLDGIFAGALNSDEKRLEKILRGDLLLARGKLDDARREYLSAGEPPANARFDAARAARLESISILLEHGQWEDAQQSLDKLQLDLPVERMSLDAGLLRLNLELGRKQFQNAFTGSRTLLRIAEGSQRQSEILYVRVESGLALGKREEAQRALQQLLRDFPYSEAAAKAKDKWTQK
jgi:tetratricopeptide (TPR) repeat protein